MADEVADEVAMSLKVFVDFNVIHSGARLGATFLEVWPRLVTILISSLVYVHDAPVLRLVPPRKI